MSGDPAQLGDYRLLEQLGQGGMAVVYRGERVGEAGFKKTVAIKRMLSHYRHDASLLERFAAEARTNARLDHPNLVAVVDFGVKPEPYLVMEFVEGVTLASVLHRLVEQGQRLEVAAACFIGAEAAAGLDHAHRKRDDAGNPLGIVHRDVSPQNVLLSNEGAVKVSDFGLVKAADNVVQTGGGIPIGKICYMAPEQAEHHEVDARADVFSLGVVVWEMLAMRVLLPPNDPARAAQLLKVGEFHPPSRYNPEVSPELDALVMSCLERDLTRRTPSAQAVGMALRETLHEVAPGYGRDQLARLLGWAFPERGWQIDEPHETAAQPSLEERMSMPPAPPAAEAMEAAQSPQPDLPTEVNVQRAPHVGPPALPAATTGSPSGPLGGAPYTTGGHPALPTSPYTTGGAPASPSTPYTTGGAPALPASDAGGGSSWPWLIIGISLGLFGLLALLVLSVALFFASGEEDDAAPPPRPAPASPSPPAAGGRQSTRIDATAPAQVYAGPDRLGTTPFDVAMEGLEGQQLVLVAPGYRPAVLRREQLFDQQHFQVSLVEDPRPDWPVYVASARRGHAYSAYGGAPLGRVPGVVLVPASGQRPALELRFDEGARHRVSLAGCSPDSVCEVHAPGAR